MAAQKYPSWHNLTQRFYSAPEPRAIFRPVSKRRAVRPYLTERQITSQHRDSAAGERFRYRH